MAFVHSLLGVLRSFRIFAMAAIFVLVAVPVQGQPHLEEGGGVFERPSHKPAAPTPEWAEPDDGSSIGDSRAPEKRLPSKSIIEEKLETKVLPPDPGGPPIPVDGGVVLLAAAGAGYAVRRLNEEKEEDDPA